MKSLLCFLFGHKFFYTSFVKTGEIYLNIFDMWVDDGNTYIHPTDHCTRCGLKIATINKEKTNESKS